MVLNFPNAAVNPNHKTISLMFQNCNFAAVMNYNVAIRDEGRLICDPYENGTGPKGHGSEADKHWPGAIERVTLAFGSGGSSPRLSGFIVLDH